MRILHIIGRLNFADGGPPVVATRLAAAQAKLGHQVSISYYSDPAIDRQTDEQLARMPFWEKVKIHRFPVASRAERLIGFEAKRLLRPLIADADIVHLHNVWETVLLRGATEARHAGKPYIVIVNGMLDPWALAQKALKKKIALGLTHRRMLNGAAMLHLLNDDERRLMEPLGITAPATIIPNGVSLEEIDPLPLRGEFLAGRPEIKARRFILFLSRLHYKKGLDYLADAYAILAKKHAEVDLVVAGPDGGERENFQNRIQASGLTDRVHVVGPLYGREKFAALVDCECFTLPSRQEGFSLAILEAMACRAPVVVSEACHFPEVAATGAGEVVALRAQAFAEAIGRVLADPNRAAMGLAGRSLVEANYTWDRVAVRTISVYQNAIEALRQRQGH